LIIYAKVDERTSQGADNRRNNRVGDRDDNDDNNDTYYSRRRDDCYDYGDRDSKKNDDRYRRDDPMRRRGRSMSGDSRNSSNRYKDRHGDSNSRRGRERYEDHVGDDNDNDAESKYRNYRKRSNSAADYSSDEQNLYGSRRSSGRSRSRSRRDGRKRSSFPRERDYDRGHDHDRGRDYERRRSRSRDHRNGDRDYDDDYDYDDEEGGVPRNTPDEPKPTEWPPSFQNEGSAFTFDARSAMFYEPLSNFFYDPKSKLYYGNKKSAYFRYDESNDPPFIEVKKMTTKEVEEHEQQGDFSQEKLAATNDQTQTPTVASKPKIAIHLKTKKVRSSISTGNSSSNQPTPATVSRVKKEQIANIGKWTEKQAELKQSEALVAAPVEATDTAVTISASSAPLQEERAQKPKQPKVRTTAKGEPICALCKRKFPNMEKLRLHEKGSELHKKNLLKLREKKKKQQSSDVGGNSKRKLEENSTDTVSAMSTNINVNANANDNGNVTPATNETVYTDRAQKRRQLHGVDLCAPANGLSSLRRLEERKEMSLELLHDNDNSNTTGGDLLDENNLGHQLLQKLGYKFGPSASEHNEQEQQQDTDSNSTSKKPRSTNEHLRKEWDRIEAMAAKSKPRPRNHSKY